MLPQSLSSRCFPKRTFALVTVFLIGMLAFNVNGQSATDAQTPPGQAPGAPAGSYPLSGFDNVNLFNGHLNFSLPVLKVGGRGGAGYTITLPIEQRWVAERLDPSTIIPNFNWWATGSEFGPGHLRGRQTSEGCPDVFSLTEGTTRLTFIMPDRTEIDLIDQVYGGQPAVSHCGQYSTDRFAGTSRGTTFVTRDGTSATFVSDQAIKDILFAMTGPYSIYPTGYLSLRDGTRYRIVAGKVQWIRDRNGNKVSFSYDAEGFRVTSVTDSINRQVTFDYDVQDPQCGTCNRINFKGAGGLSRKIWVVHKQLRDALAPGQSPKTYGGPNGLFPELSGSSTTEHDPGVLATVILPNLERYEFYYNSYGELAKVKLPTGGTIFYDWGAGDLAGTPSGYSMGQLYRRVLERRTYTDDGITLASLTSFGRYDNVTGPEGSAIVKNLEIDGSQAVVTQSKHYFFDGPLGYINDAPGWPSDLLDGREKQTEQFHTNGSTVLRRVTHTWTTGGTVAGTPINPRLTQSINTIEPATTNLVSKQTFSYDTYNNQTDIYEYDLQAVSPGPLVRRTHTDYLTTNAVNGINYATSSSIHLRSLIQQQQTFDGNGVQRSLTIYEYDNYATDTNHAGLVNRTNISGLDSSFTTSYGTRGNPTAVTRYLLNSTGGITGSTSTYQQYDIAGNGVKVIDARGNATDFDFSDRFGTADGNAQANSGPTELGTQASYAFTTKVTNALGHTAYSQFDYQLGAPVDTEDANGVVSSRYYVDSLDRITQFILAMGTGAANQTSFEYNDSGHFITVSKDRDNLNDNLLVSKGFYDGLGRTTETRQYENSSTYIVTKTKYDALGRPYKVSDPYRTGQTASWTTQSFDALGRLTSVKTADNAVVSTSYAGNIATVTDQAGKARKSVTDALGRLIEVYEDPNGLNYQTRYTYDSLDNLVKVDQGGQLRFFMYDSLKRLIRADNPEQETLSALNLTDPVTSHSNWTAKYEYDNNGNLTFKTDARGTVTENRYDELNRVNTVLYRINGQPDPNTGDIQYVYDNATNGKGRLWLTYRWGAKPSHTAVGEYDALGRVKQLWNLFGDGVGGWSAGYGVSRNYNLAGQVTSQTYPSGHTANYSYDAAGRTSGFTGNLGDGVTRSYASSFIYNARGQVTQELFGTATPLYHKLQYNIRGQLWDVRVSTNPDVNGSSNRGGLQYFYDGSLGYGTSGPDNNGNVRFANTYTPEDEQDTKWAIHRQSYTYDTLNRLKSVTEYFVNYNHPESQQSVQTYDYDRWGNRTIKTDQTSGTGINNTAFEVETARNRLYSPGDLALTDSQRRIRYDQAGNQIKDTYTGFGTATFDGDNHIVAIQDKFGGSSTYTYNANAQRVRRKINNQETWQIYGIDGELVAEYAANAVLGTPQKEYGYRDGQLLVTASGSSRVNVALSTNGATATAQNYTQDGVFAGYHFYPSSAIDGQRYGHLIAGGGDINGFWRDEHGLPSWLEVNFNGSKTIEEIDVFTVPECPACLTQADPSPTQTFSQYGVTGFEVQYWTGSSWATVPGGSISSNNLVWRKLTFAAITTSKIRVMVTAAATDGVARIAEIEAWTTSPNNNTTVNWLVPDHLGTPRIILDQTGSLANLKRHDYLPFGEELLADTGGRTTAMGYVAGDGVRQQFTIKERDIETGLDYFLARYYSLLQGRFTSPDEFTGGPDELFDFADRASDNPTFYGELANPQSLNKYQYTYNDPLNLTDPDGHCPPCLAAAAAAVVILLSPDTTQAPTGNETEPLARSGDGIQRVVANGMATAPLVRTVVTLDRARSAAAAERKARQADTDRLVKKVANEAQRSGVTSGSGGAAIARTGERFTALSGESKLHPVVQRIYDSVPSRLRKVFHGKCCEGNTTTQMINAGVNPRGATYSVVRIRKVGDAEHGTHLPACPSCQHLFKGIDKVFK